jgi:hypothetical protein
VLCDRISVHSYTVLQNWCAQLHCYKIGVHSYIVLQNWCAQLHCVTKLVCTVTMRYKIRTLTSKTVHYLAERSAVKNIRFLLPDASANGKASTFLSVVICVQSIV